MKKAEKIIIEKPVAIGGKHYAPSDKPVTVSAEDARYLIPRGLARKFAPAKSERK